MHAARLRKPIWRQFIVILTARSTTMTITTRHTSPSRGDRSLEGGAPAVVAPPARLEFFELVLTGGGRWFLLLNKRRVSSSIARSTNDRDWARFCRLEAASDIAADRRGCNRMPE